MEALFILIGISLLMAFVFLVAFLWSVNNGQYDDSYTPSVRILLDEVEAQQEKVPDNLTIK